MLEKTLYTTDEFKEQFSKTDFDNYLIEQNNSLVNSNEYYLQYKNTYIETTKNNYNTYTKLLDKYNTLTNNYTITSNKYIYQVIDNKKYDSLNMEIKTLVEEQKKLFNNFIHYIEFLNTSLTTSTNK
jgi:hypothetical protein